MRVSIIRLRTLVLSFLSAALVGCSTAPSEPAPDQPDPSGPSDRLRIVGHLDVSGPWAPERRIGVTARVYSESQPYVSFPLSLDATGFYQGEVGGLKEGVADSVVITLGETACWKGYYVTVRRYAVRSADGTLIIPSQKLPFGGSPVPLQEGTRLCGSIDGGYANEQVVLRLVVDSLNDRVYGRYQAVHNVSCGHQSGSFIGIRTPASMSLTLTAAPSETPLSLVVTAQLSAGSLVSAATVTGSDPNQHANTCYIPTGRTYLYGDSTVSRGWP